MISLKNNFINDILYLLRAIAATAAVVPLPA